MTVRRLEATQSLYPGRMAAWCPDRQVSYNVSLTAWQAAVGRFHRTGLWLGRWRTCQTCGRVLLPDTAAENCQEHLQD